jgi:hypothetical protein
VSGTIIYAVINHDINCSSFKKFSSHFQLIGFHDAVVSAGSAASGGSHMWDGCVHGKPQAYEQHPHLSLLNTEQTILE